MLKTGKTTQRDRAINDTINPKLVPKNCLKIAPVYPSNAEMSNFKRMRVLDKSIGFSMVPINDILSNGYSSNNINDIKKMPS